MEDFEKDYWYVSAMKSVLLFILLPARFIKYALKYDMALNLATSPDLKKSYMAGKYNPQEEDFKKNVVSRTSSLRNSLWISGIVVLLTIFLGIYCGVLMEKIYGHPSENISKLITILGAGTLLWATLWELGWRDRSIGGETLPERVHSWLFRTLYIIGTFFLFLGIAW